MFLYNVTVNINPEVEEDWKRWMKDDHIQKVIDTGKFYDFRFLKLLNEHPDADGITYAIQYFAKSLGDIEDYLENDADKLKKDHFEKFKDKFVAFRTILEEV